jgi:hypothetical protein
MVAVRTLPVSVILLARKRRIAERGGGEGGKKERVKTEKMKTGQNCVQKLCQSLVELNCGMRRL